MQRESTEVGRSSGSIHAKIRTWIWLALAVVAGVTNRDPALIVGALILGRLDCIMGYGT